MINWDSYEIYDPGVSGPLHELPRREARQFYNRLMAAKSARIEMLRQFLRANGEDLIDTDDGILRLDDWFFANLEPDPDKPGRPLPEWYSVVYDVALFLGDTIIARCPGLHWEFFTWGTKNYSYPQPTIMGFTQVVSPKIDFNIVGAVSTYAHRIVESRGSIPTYGKVTIRGVELDLDAGLAKSPRPPVESGEFLRFVWHAESKA